MVVESMTAESWTLHCRGYGDDENDVSRISNIHPRDNISNCY